MCSLENAIETLDKCVLVSKEVFNILLGEYRKHHSEEETTLLIDEQDCGCATEGEIITLLKASREEQKETPNRYGIPLDIMLHPEKVDVNSIPWLPTPPEMLAIIEKLRKDIDELDKMWEGPAHDVFSKEFKDSVGDMEDIFKKYRKLTEFEKAAYYSYSRANQNCANKIASLK